MPNHCDKCGAKLRGGAADKRAKPWHARARVFEAMKPDETIADSDPQLPLGEIPRDILHYGLPELVETLSGWLHNEVFPGEVLFGLQPETLLWRIKNVRTTISRHKGAPVSLKVPFDTVATYRDAEGHKPAYFVRVDFIRATKGD